MNRFVPIALAMLMSHTAAAPANPQVNMEELTTAIQRALDTLSHTHSQKGGSSGFVDETTDCPKVCVEMLPPSDDGPVFGLRLQSCIQTCTCMKHPARSAEQCVNSPQEFVCPLVCSNVFPDVPIAASACERSCKCTLQGLGDTADGRLQRARKCVAEESLPMCLGAEEPSTCIGTVAGATCSAALGHSFGVDFDLLVCGVDVAMFAFGFNDAGLACSSACGIIPADQLLIPCDAIVPQCACELGNRGYFRSSAVDEVSSLCIAAVCTGGDNQLKADIPLPKVEMTDVDMRTSYPELYTIADQEMIDADDMIGAVEEKGGKDRQCTLNSCGLRTSSAVGQPTDGGALVDFLLLQQTCSCEANAIGDGKNPTSCARHTCTDMCAEVFDLKPRTFGGSVCQRLCGCHVEGLRPGTISTTNCVRTACDDDIFGLKRKECVELGCLIPCALESSPGSKEFNACMEGCKCEAFRNTPGGCDRNSKMW